MTDTTTKPSEALRDLVTGLPKLWEACRAAIPEAERLEADLADVKLERDAFQAEAIERGEQRDRYKAALESILETIETAASLEGSEAEATWEEYRDLVRTDFPAIVRQALEPEA